MSQTNRQLVGSIVERKPSTFSPSSQPTLSGSSQTGFPAVQHRSKSAFARGREDLKRNGVAGANKSKQVPVVQPVAIERGTGARSPLTEKTSTKAYKNTNDLRRQISEENEIKVQNMTPEERDQERREIIEQFGNGVGDLLKKAKEARRRREDQDSGKAVDKLETEGTCSNTTPILSLIFVSV